MENTSPPGNGSGGYVGASAPVSAGGGGVRLVKKGGRPSAEEFKPPRLVKGGPVPRPPAGSGGDSSRPGTFVIESADSEMGSPPGRRPGGGGGFDGFSSGGRNDGFMLGAGRAGGVGGGGGGGRDDFDLEDARTDNGSLSRSRFSRVKLSKRFSFYKDRATTPDRLGLLRAGPQDMEHAWGPAPMRGSDQKEGRWCSPRRCCCCCCCSLVVLIFLLGLAALITYLVIKPKAPDFTIEDIKIDSIGIRESGSKFDLDAVVNITILSQNPNRVGILYEKMTFDTRYRQRSLGEAEGTKRVRQNARSTVLLMAVLEIRGADVTDVQSDIDTDLRDGTLPLDIFGTVVVRVEYKGFRSPRLQVKVDCRVVVLIDPVTRRGHGLQSNKCGEIHDVKLV